jgi:hypothetical protein
MADLAAPGRQAVPSPFGRAARRVILGPTMDDNRFAIQVMELADNDSGKA